MLLRMTVGIHETLCFALALLEAPLLKPLFSLSLEIVDRPILAGRARRRNSGSSRIRLPNLHRGSKKVGESTTSDIATHRLQNCAAMNFTFFSDLVVCLMGKLVCLIFPAAGSTLVSTSGLWVIHWCAHIQEWRWRRACLLVEPGRFFRPWELVHRTRPSARAESSQFHEFEAERVEIHKAHKHEQEKQASHRRGPDSSRQP
mmetsp:Transcript_21381/g.35260  ORF Transcript_21381/g.35260 Transcript_21381/m.35260 type:complete len:202 (+) Transcript_21381:267-872(+)